MKVLFCIHCENNFKNFFGHTFEAELAKLVYGGGYDTVILLDSDDLGGGCIPLLNNNFEAWYWSWGYEPEMFEEDEQEWVIPAHGSEWTYIPPEIRNGRFTNADIHIAGGGDSECLQCWRDILEYLDLDYTETGVIF